MRQETARQPGALSGGLKEPRHPGGGHV